MSVTSAHTGTRFPFLPIPEHDFYLDSRRIDIWEYSLAKFWPAAESLLNEEELQRAKRFYFSASLQQQAVL